MSKRAFLIHGWGGEPGGDFLPWLKQQLEKNEYYVEALDMPDTENPVIEKWLPFMLSKIQSPDENTVIIGHSMGALATLMFLEKIPEGTKIGKIVLIAGVIKKITGLEPDQLKKVKAWLEADLNYKKIRASAKEIIAYFSDNDKYIPLETAKLAEEKLGAKIVIEKNKGHYTESSGIKQVTKILETVLEN